MSKKKFLSALGPKDQVTVTAFNDNMFTLAKRETSVPLRIRAIDRLSAWGGTALYDVIIRGVQQLSKQPGRRVLVVFSDGDDRTSHATIQAVEAAVRANDATLFMVALGRGVKEAQLKSGIERLVELSGGRALFEEFFERMERYHATRDFPAVKGPSYLGVHLRFGTVSIRRLAAIAYQRMLHGDAGATVWQPAGGAPESGSKSRARSAR